MAKKSGLPIEVHDHFRKANVLHTYVQNSLGEATKHALETGQELMAAKQSIPHGVWEEECGRLFDGSARTARFYMQFARDMATLKTAQANAVLFLEGGMDVASKAARKAAAEAGGKQPPKPRKPPKDDPIDVEFEDAPEADQTDLDEQEPISRPPRNGKDKPADYGKCPNCAGTKWDTDEDEYISCCKCHHPHGEPAGDVDEDRLTTQRQKTVKTLEAAMRAFDDLQTMCAKREHGGREDTDNVDIPEAVKDIGVIKVCKGLLKIAKEWK